MTLLRTLTLLAFITALSLLLAWLADAPGSVTIDWRGWRIETSLLLLIGSIGFVLLLLFSLLWSARKLITLPSVLSGGRGAKRYEQGLTALTEAFSALSLADAAQARKSTERAMRLLNNAPIVHLLAAQLARLEGDDVQMRHQLEQLLKDPKTEFAATRSLLEAARRKEDWAVAASLGERALTLQPKDRWSMLSLIDAYLHQSRWQDILGLLERAKRKRGITREEYLRYYALTHYLHGTALFSQTQYVTAESSLQYAQRRLPDFAPATALLARTQARRGNTNGAMKTLVRGWKIITHPDLADAFFELVRTEKDSSRIMASAEQIAGGAPGHPESLVLLAQAALQARQPARARGYLLTLIEREPIHRAYRLLAELEQASDPTAAAEWLSKSAQTERDYAWECAVCSHTIPVWKAHCSSCGNFDSFRWQLPRSNALTSKKK